MGVRRLRLLRGDELNARLLFLKSKDHRGCMFLYVERWECGGVELFCLCQVVDVERYVHDAVHHVYPMQRSGMRS